MSNKGKFVDSTPFIPTAGKTNTTEDINADYSIRQDLYYRPATQTPQHLVKYRNTTRQIPGKKQLHVGIYDDPKDYEQLVHGVPTALSDHVPDCIKGRNLSGTKYFINDIKENMFYASTKREPLGKGIKRNYRFPTEVNEKDFKFGIPTVGLLNAKEVIYNGCKLEEPPEVKELYKKTHGYCDPGEQKDRKYKWYFDKRDHQFGLPQEKERDGVKKCLLIDTSESPYPKTKLASKRLEDFRQASTDMLGIPRYKGTLHPKIGPDHTFGVANKLSGFWNAGKCIFGDPQETSKESMMPDKDLGRDVRYRSKIKNLQPIEYDINKACGIPSIRRDLPKKELPRVTDMVNYGDEEDVYELLYPHPCATMGVRDEDFDVLHTKEEIVQILKENKYRIPDEELNTVFDIALKNYPNEEGKLSYTSFVNTLRLLKREYMRYRTLVPQ